MKPLIKSFRDFVVQENLFSQEDKLLLAASGGLDSTVLAHLLRAEGYDFAIAHMNFQLRGEASEGDAAFVAELARTLGAKYFSKAVDVKSQAMPGESTQMTARRLRYDWFERLLSDHNYDYLLTGHHANDNLETFLINLLRGTGLRGLAGVAPRRASFCHPLLEITRSSLEEFARASGITWREDASNDTDDYLRNRVRHKITPLLRQDFAYPAARWAATAENLRSDLFLRDYGLRALTDEFVLNAADGSTILQRSKIESPAIFKALLYELGKQHNFSAEQIRQMSTVKGNRQFASSSHRAYVSEQHIRFACRPDNDDAPLPELTVQALPFTTELGIAPSLTIAAASRPELLAQPNTLFLAPAPLPLHLRPRRKGDRLQPLGLGGKSKKVKDYLIDQKVPIWQRDKIYLLVDPNDDIMAITGHCITEPYKVLPEHDTVIRISWA